ncbi:MAG: helix-turn-helix transcriptional regulator [bacterium]|nr:helix-turn-helix transcriptional regulator [bacterium]
MIKSRAMLQEVALKLRKLRKQLGYTKSQMAARVGLTPSGYYRNEGGETFPNFKTLRMLCSEHDISMDWFIFNKGPMYFKEKVEPKEKEPEVIIKTVEVPKELPKDIQELMDHMEGIPLLHHEVLAYFQRFKVDNKDLVKSSMEQEKE